MTTSQSRPIPANVSQIVLECAGNITLRQGTVPSMIVRCSHPDYLDHLITDVSVDCLIIAMKPVVISPTIEDPASILGQIFGRSIQIKTGNQTIQIGSGIISTPAMSFEVDLVLPDVTSLRIKGSGNFTYEQARQARLSVLIAGSGSIEIQGVVDTLEVHIAGSGNICARSLRSQKLNAQISGSGSIEATALASVTARISGSGDINVFGNPAEHDTRVSGSGRIKIKKEGRSEHPHRSDDAPHG